MDFLFAFKECLSDTIHGLDIRHYSNILIYSTLLIKQKVSADDKLTLKFYITSIEIYFFAGGVVDGVVVAGGGTAVGKVGIAEGSTAF